VTPPVVVVVVVVVVGVGGELWLYFPIDPSLSSATSSLTITAIVESRSGGIACIPCQEVWSPHRGGGEEVVVVVDDYYYT